MIINDVAGCRGMDRLEVGDTTVVRSSEDECSGVVARITSIISIIISSRITITSSSIVSRVATAVIGAAAGAISTTTAATHKTAAGTAVPEDGSWGIGP